MHQEQPGPRTRREARTLTEAPAVETRPPRRRRHWIWIALVIALILLLTAAVVAAVQLYERAMTTRSHLEAAMAEVSTVQESILSQDTAAASEAAARLAEETSAAVSPTQGRLWAVGEWVPWIGSNLTAVREVAEVTDSLVAEAVTPATQLDLSALTPSGGRIDVAALGGLSSLVDGVVAEVDRAGARIGAIHTDGLIDEVASGVARLDGALARLDETLSPIHDVLGVLPEALGANGPRNYLVMFQGNSEARSLAGNAAVFIVIRVDNGAIAITEHVDSSDFRQPTEEPVVSLDPEAVTIYGDKIGRYTPDFTMVPDFPTATGILQGWWNRDVGTDVDAYISMDPVALSYLLAVTGPVTLPTGDSLTAENAVPLLLNEAYFRYEDPLMQNAFFGSAADAVFTKLTSGAGSPTAMISALARAVEEGRLLYSSEDPDEMALIGTTRMAGRMPTDGKPLLGVYVNDNTASKKSYYLDMSIMACLGGGQARASVTLASSLEEAEASRLPYYIAGPYFAPGEISSYIVLYGPVGSSLVSASVDGSAVTPLAVGQHLGRPAVKVEVLNRFVSEHTVDVTFDGVAGDGDELEVWHTPMTRETPVETSTCTP
ncbi:DUF4012 domain-containing protein [Microbacterium sp. LEMMJ01]|uniref:DUF4012 domain-containing protein n=1 Tax=Microbacterium sp. LEMMJ01 TaxID=1978350 RepID=UPI00111C4D59|nr:DUF4012 domain-containing protein [Microbacterium sp. LEMMJ01]